MGLLRAKQAAEWLGISHRQLQDLTRAGRIPFVELGLGARPVYRYDPADLASLQKAMFNTPRDDAPETTPESIPTIDVPPPAGKPGSGASYVYFIIAGDLVKIGRARCIKNRMNALQSGCPHPIRLVRYIGGGEATERRLHRKFSEYRVRAEWFRLEGDLETFLRDTAP